MSPSSSAEYLLNKRTHCVLRAAWEGMWTSPVRMYYVTVLLAVVPPLRSFAWTYKSSNKGRSIQCHLENNFVIHTLLIEYDHPRLSHLIYLHWLFWFADHTQTQFVALIRTVFWPLGRDPNLVVSCSSYLSPLSQFTGATSVHVPVPYLFNEDSTSLLLNFLTLSHNHYLQLYYFVVVFLDSYHLFPLLFRRGTCWSGLSISGNIMIFQNSPNN